jgi:glycosyltransferase involved in cell wall biosynthesis
MTTSPRLLKVALICISDPHSGGSVSYERNLVRVLTTELSDQFEFVVFSPEGSSSLNKHTLTEQKSITYKIGLVSLFFMSIRLSLPGYAILKRIGLRYGRFERRMKKEGVALAYFISPNPLALDLVDTPMMNTVWDLGHRDLPEFLEITGDRHFEERETFFSHVLPKSFRVFVDTETTAKKISQYYGVDPARIVPTGLIFKTETIKYEPRIVEDEFQGKLFFLYPAQLWPHKRHALLFNAFAQLRDKHPNISLVLTGSDKGNRSHLEQLRDNLGLTDSIHFLGFVSDERLSSLMQHAHCLVFPSSLGPSNLPPLEAAVLGTPSLISSVHHDPALENRLITVVPQQSVDAWVNAMSATLTDEKIVREPVSLLTINISEVVSTALYSFSESRIEWQ